MSKFTFWFVGILIIIASVLINWKKLSVFIIIGVGFIIYGFTKQKKKPKQKNLHSRQANYINRKY